MYISLKEVLLIFITIFIFLFINSIHKIIFSEYYSSISINKFNYEQNSNNQKSSFFLRLLLIIIETFVLSYFIELKLIMVGFTISAFLIVWPPIVYFKLLMFPITIQKIIILSRYLLYILNVVATIFFTKNIILKSFLGEKVFFFDNTGLNLMYNIFLLAFPFFIDYLIGKTYYINYDVNIDAFYEEVRLTVESVEMNKYYLAKYFKYEIKKYSKKYNINPRIIMYILCIEDIYRGYSLNRNLEKLYCHFFYKSAIEKDVSVGIAQIKISTFSKILKTSPLNFQRKIFNVGFSIKVLSLIIKDALDSYSATSENDIYAHIANIYNGNYNNSINVKIYSAVLRTLMENESLKYGKLPYWLE